MSGARRTAFVLDGDSSPAVAVTRSLGRAGWRVVAPAGTRAGRSRFAAKTIAPPHVEREPDRFSETLVRVLARERPDVVAPCSDASVEPVWAGGDALGDPRALGGDRESAATLTAEAATLELAAEAGFPTRSGSRRRRSTRRSRRCGAWGCPRW